MKTFSEVLIELGFSQKEFSELSGIQKSSISDYCSMKQIPSRQGYEKLVKALGEDVVKNINWGTPEEVAENKKKNGGARKGFNPNRDTVLVAESKERKLFALNSKYLMYNQHLSFERCSQRSGLSESTIRACWDSSVNVKKQSASCLAQALGSTLKELCTVDKFGLLKDSESKPESIDNPDEDASIKSEKNSSFVKEGQTLADYINQGFYEGMAAQPAQKEFVRNALQIETKPKDGELYISVDKLLVELDKRAKKEREKLLRIMGEVEDWYSVADYRKILDIYEFELPVMVNKLCKSQ